MINRVEQLLKRLAEVEALLGESDILQDQNRYRELVQEHSYLNSIKNVWEQLKKAEKELSDNKQLLKGEQDPDFREMISTEVEALEKLIPDLKKKVENLLVPPDPTDSRNLIIELRAGTGGDEAALFVANCVRMYKLFADNMGWKTELLSATESDLGGYREYIMGVSGPNAYRFMKYEAGTHRVQRVPETETQGRVHTSAITVAVLLEPDDEELVVIDEKDLKVDTYRASGAGGQHVNTTDSAVRLTHEPTGIVVTCQEERSQHKNKEKAMRLLSAKINEEKRRKQAQEVASLRSTMVGSGDRSERIRTYNFPQNRISDHRINLTLYNLDQVMEGRLQEISEALVSHFYQLELQGEG